MKRKKPATPKKMGWLNQAIRSASAKTFALTLFAFDIVVMNTLALLVAGVTYLRASGAEMTDRVLLAFLALFAAKATMVILRSLAPFVLRLSFAGMMRLRLPFFVWMAAIIMAISLAPPVVRMFASLNVATVQLTLILVSMSFVMRFLQTGSVFRMAISYTCAGAALGISLIGVLGIVAIWVLMYFLPDRLFESDGGGYGWKDEPKKPVVDFFMNPMIRSRIKWIFCLLFFCGLTFAVWRVYLPDGHLPSLKALGAGWLAGANLSGGIVFLATVVLPVFIVLSRVAHVSDANTPLTLSELMPHVVIGALSALFILKPQVVSSALGLALGVDDLFKVIAVVAGGFNILVSALVLLIDIRCRDYEILGVKSDVMVTQMRFTYVMATVAPILLAGAVAFLTVRRSGPLTFSLGVEPPSEVQEVEMALSSREAMRISAERKNMAQAEHYARLIIADEPGDLEANRLLLQCYAEKGNLAAIEPLADRVQAVARDSLDALNFAVGVYETCGKTNKAAKIRERIAAVRAKAD